MRIRIPLPELKKDLLITKGQNVKIGDPIVNQETAQDFVVELSDMLGFAPKKIFSVLRKFVGDDVKKGDIIAANSSAFSSRQYASMYDGVIREVNHITGSITIEAFAGEKVEIPAFFNGEVVNILENIVELEVKEAVELALTQPVALFGGRAVYTEGPKSLTLSQTNGCVVVDPRITPYELAKYSALGATGFVTLKKPEDDEDLDLPLACVKQKVEFEVVFKEEFPYAVTSQDFHHIIFYK